MHLSPGAIIESLSPFWEGLEAPHLCYVLGFERIHFFSSFSLFDLGLVICSL